MLQIITNNHVRELKYIWELSPKEQKAVKNSHNFDWINDSSVTNWDEELFINYKDYWFCLSDFMSLHNHVYCPTPPKEFNGWDGYTNDSYFSGTLIKLLGDNQCVMGFFVS